MEKKEVKLSLKIPGKGQTGLTPPIQDPNIVPKSPASTRSNFQMGKKDLDYSNNLLTPNVHNKQVIYRYIYM